MSSSGSDGSTDTKSSSATSSSTSSSSDSSASSDNTSGSSTSGGSTSDSGSNSADSSNNSEGDSTGNAASADSGSSTTNSSADSSDSDTADTNSDDSDDSSASAETSASTEAAPAASDNSGHKKADSTGSSNDSSKEQAAEDKDNSTQPEKSSDSAGDSLTEDSANRDTGQDSETANNQGSSSNGSDSSSSSGSTNSSPESPGETSTNDNSGTADNTKPVKQDDSKADKSAEENDQDTNRDAAADEQAAETQDKETGEKDPLTDSLTVDESKQLAECSTPKKEEPAEEEGNSYTASISPDAVVGAGEETTFKATFTEVGDQTIGSAELSLPEGFSKGTDSDLQVTSSLDNEDNANWQANWQESSGLLSIVMQAQNDNSLLHKGGWVSVLFNAITPAEPAGGSETYAFETKAWTDRDGKIKNNPASGSYDGVEYDHSAEELPVTVSETIQGALDAEAVDKGSIVHVHPGTYDEDVTIAKEGVSLKATEKEAAVIEGSVEIAADRVTLEGITVNSKEKESAVTVEDSGNSYIATIDTSAILEDDIDEGDEQEFTITFLEIGSDTLGAANITMPEAFSLQEEGITITTSRDKSWDHNVDDQTLEISAATESDYLNQGESVSVTFNTEVVNADPGAHEFETEAWQDNERADENHMAAGYTNPVVIVGESVSNESELAAMTLTGHYILTEDINPENDSYIDWTPIGARDEDHIMNGEAPLFRGSLHGNGYAINDMDIELPNGNNRNIGMFAETDGAWLVDISLNNLWILVDDVSNEPNNGNKVYNSIGGLVGKAESTNIINSSISGEILFDTYSEGRDLYVEYVGGMAGYMSGGSTISSSHADVDITLLLATEVDTPDYYNVNALWIGGLSGLSGNSEIGGSYAEGSIDVLFEIVPGESFGHTWLYAVGGLVGEQGSNSSINMSYSDVEITGSAEGHIEYVLFDCIGGLVGDNDGHITNSYALGSLELSGYSSSHGLYALGGLVGQNQSNGSIKNSYTAGTMAYYDFTGDHHEEFEPKTGGLVGVNESGGTVTNSFYDSDKTDQSDTDRGYPRTTAQMQQASTFRNEGWSITGGSGHYPRLWWEYEPERPQAIWHIGTADEPCEYWSPCAPASPSAYTQTVLHTEAIDEPYEYRSPCTPFSPTAFTKTGDPHKHLKTDAEADKEPRALPPTGGTSHRLWAALMWLAAGFIVLFVSKSTALPGTARAKISKFRYGRH